jgi:hypothetical protein
MDKPQRTELRDKVTALFAGVHMDDKLWQRVADAFDWEDVWPVIDGDCCLTGEVVEPKDWDYFPHWPSWDAVIHRDVAQAAGWTVDREAGHASPAKG